jgi:hypothetical protein
MRSMKRSKRSGGKCALASTMPIVSDGMMVKLVEREASAKKGGGGGSCVVSRRLHVAQSEEAGATLARVANALIIQRSLERGTEGLVVFHAADLGKASEAGAAGRESAMLV